MFQSVKSDEMLSSGEVSGGHAVFVRAKFNIAFTKLLWQYKSKVVEWNDLAENEKNCLCALPLLTWLGMLML